MRLFATLLALSVVSSTALAAGPATVPAPQQAAPLPVARPAASAPAPAVNASDQVFSDASASLNREIYLLSLQVKASDLKKKLAGGSASEPLPAPTSVISAPPRAMTAPKSTPIASVRLDPPAARPSLSLAGVIIIGRHAQATIRDHGIEVRARVGARLPSGWVVTAIGPTHAELSRGHEHKRLALGY